MANSDARDLLQRSGLRVTPQRRAIIEAFRGGLAEHLSAEEVHARASVAVPDVGRGTVYATLAELAELGLLGSVGDSDPVRYEINLERHDHFRCRLCMRMFDVDLGGRGVARRGLEGFRLEQVAVIAEGVCAECIDYRRGLEEGAAEVLARPLLDGNALSALAGVRVDSPVGELAVAASESGIVRIAFADHADHGSIVARGRRGPQAARARLTHLAGSLEAYFGGGRAAMRDVVDWRLSGEHAAAALTATTEIPYAGSLSYERVLDGLSPLDCGRVMGANPIPLLTPCHRVSCGSERPEVYVGGVERLRFLRRLEAA